MDCQLIVFMVERIGGFVITKEYIVAFALAFTVFIPVSIPASYTILAHQSFSQLLNPSLTHQPSTLAQSLALPLVIVRVHLCSSSCLLLLWPLSINWPRQ